LIVPSGEGAGRPFRLREFQKRFIRDIYEPHDRLTERRLVRRAILSMARKNGKTALIAALALAHLIGPEAEKNAEIYSAANDREQAGQIFKMARQMVEADPSSDPSSRSSRPPRRSSVTATAPSIVPSAPRLEPSTALTRPWSFSTS
jgi:phage terminase large subunit-like protein